MHRYLVDIAAGLRSEAEAPETLALTIGQAVVVKFDRHEDAGTVFRCLSTSTPHPAPPAQTGPTPADQPLDDQPDDGDEPTEHSGDDDDGADSQLEDPPASQARQPSPGCGGGVAGSGGGDGPHGALPQIVRLASPADQARILDNLSRAASMLATAQRKAKEHHLQMKLVSCHYTFDRNLALFQFTSDGRVDFRNLVRDLSGALHTRVELRQIGVRDESAMLGGIGPCGRVFCCASVLDHFYSVNVKMAKIQRLSLNPASVSGGCGRLKCCLRYEVDGYKEMCRGLPRNGCRCETPDGPGRVMDCNALTRRVRIRLEGDSAQFKEYPVDDLQVAPRGPAEAERAAADAPRQDNRPPRRGRDRRDQRPANPPAANPAPNRPPATNVPNRPPNADNPAENRPDKPENA